MLTARTALLLALRQGPSYGRQLVRRIRTATDGQVRLAEGSVYPALRRLESAQLVRSWTIIPGRRPGGRARRYYELTERGGRASLAASRALAALLQLPAAERRVSAAQVARMRQRIELGAELSETALLLSLDTSRGGRRRTA